MAPVGITEQGIPADVSDCSITSGGRGGVSVGGQWEKELEYGSIACVVVMLRGNRGRKGGVWKEKVHFENISMI